MTHIEIIEKLIGPIEPVGDSAIDEKRLGNIDEYLNLFDEMYGKLISIHMRNKGMHQHSIKEVVKCIETRLSGIKEDLNNREL